jgi:hypothetical protein
MPHPNIQQSHETTIKSYQTPPNLINLNVKASRLGPTIRQKVKTLNGNDKD